MSRATRAGLVASVVVALGAAALVVIPGLGESSLDPYEAGTSAFSNATVVLTGDVVAVERAWLGWGFAEVVLQPVEVHDAQDQDWNVGSLAPVVDLPTDRPLTLRLDPDWTLETGDTVTVAVSQPFEPGDDDGQITFVLVDGTPAQVEGDAAAAATLFGDARDLRPDRTSVDVLVELARDGDDYLDALNGSSTDDPVDVPGLLGDAAEQLRDDSQQRNAGLHSRPG